MRMTFFNKFLLFWMLIWLPVSGAMAAVMPISGMLGNASVILAPNALTNTREADVSAAPSDAVTSSMPCHGSQPAGETPPSGTCTHCVLCHLAVSLMLPNFPVVQGIAPSREYSTTPLLSHTSFVPDLASPPPRTRQS